MAERQQKGPQRPPRPRAQRYIPPDVWEPHKPAIVDLFKQGLSHIKIIKRMNIEFGFNASVKQYKAQFSRWQLKRNMNKSDAAHILRLIVDAEAQGRFRIVFFFDKQKTRADLTTYLKKTNLVNGEDELLATLADADERPDYITYEDLPPVTDGSGGTLLRPPALADPASEMYNPNTVSPRNSDSSLGSYVMLPPPEYAEGSLDQQPAPPVDNNLQFSSPEQTFLGFNSAPFPNQGFIGTARLNPFTETLEPLENPPYPGAMLPIDTSTFHSLMSRTPPPLGGGDSSWRDLENPNSPTDQVTAMLGSDQEDGTGNEESYSRTFLRRCCEACIYFGQQQEELGDSALDRVADAFDLVLQHELEKSFTALNNLIALFESYGQKELAIRIFGLARAVADGRFGGVNTVTATIEFMTNIPEPGSGLRPNYDIHLLRDIYEQMRHTWGPESKLTLTARYNLAWALAEMKEYDEAREILVQLIEPCENMFGPCQLQTIGVIATLARVHSMTEQEARAERMIRETVAPRLEERFQISHPYFWEARNRHALFLMRLAKSQQHAPTKQRYEQKAEEMLREVLLSRYHVLGQNNPRTTVTFRALRRLLLRQKRKPEADLLYEWASTAIHPNQQILLPQQYSASNVP